MEEQRVPMFLVVPCTFFHLGANVKCSALGQKQWWIHPPGSLACFKETLRMRDIGKREGVISGNRSLMSNEKLPNGTSAALHQGRWSWRGGCSRQMLKTASQATHLCSWVPSMPWSIQNPSANQIMWVRDKERNYSGADRNRQELGGVCVWLLTPNNQTKTFSTLWGWPHWAKTKSSPLKAPMECKANFPVILPLQSVFLSLSSCIAGALHLDLFSWGHN